MSNTKSATARLLESAEAESAAQAALTHAGDLLRLADTALRLAKVARALKQTHDAEGRGTEEILKESAADKAAHDAFRCYRDAREFYPAAKRLLFFGEGQERFFRQGSSYLPKLQTPRVDVFAPARRALCDIHETTILDETCDWQHLQRLAQQIKSCDTSNDILTLLGRVELLEGVVRLFVRAGLAGSTDFVTQAIAFQAAHKALHPGQYKEENPDGNPGCNTDS